MSFTPLPGDRAGPTFTVFGMWGQITDVITHVKFQIDRSRGFGATGAKNRGFQTLIIALTTVLRTNVLRCD